MPENFIFIAFYFVLPKRKRTSFIQSQWYCCSNNTSLLELASSHPERSRKNSPHGGWFRRLNLHSVEQRGKPALWVEIPLGCKFGEASLLSRGKAVLNTAVTLLASGCSPDPDRNQHGPEDRLDAQQ